MQYINCVLGHWKWWNAMYGREFVVHRNFIDAASGNYKFVNGMVCNLFFFYFFSLFLSLVCSIVCLLAGVSHFFLCSRNKYLFACKLYSPAMAEKSVCDIGDANACCKCCLNAMRKAGMKGVKMAYKINMFRVDEKECTTRPTPHTLIDLVNSEFTNLKRNLKFFAPAQSN